jgi:PAS domain S-box-containing protein
MMVVNGSGQYVEVNPAACRISGYDEAELLAMSLTDLLAEESLESGSKHFATVKELGHASSELCWIHKDGSKRWSTCDAVKLSEDRFLACFLEVTGRRTMEESLRQSEQRYRNLVELSPDAVFINRDNRVVLVNPAAVQLFGADNPRQILGRSPFELFHADHHPIMRERIAGLLEGRSATLIECKIVRLDGTVRFSAIRCPRAPSMNLLASRPEGPVKP